jgi:hypothetical protein
MQEYRKLGCKVITLNHGTFLEKYGIISISKTSVVK